MEEKETDAEQATKRSGVSRREFIAGTVGGVVAGAALSAAGSLGLPRTVRAATQPAAQTQGLSQSPVPSIEESRMPATWDLAADVVVIGSGGAGLPAALAARAAGASVIVVDANFDVGGHAIVSGGGLPLGGGTAVQQKYNIVDSPDLLFSDLVDWSVVNSSGFPAYRYNDRDLMRAFVDNNVAYYNFLVANGVTFVDTAPTSSGTDGGESVARNLSVSYTGGATSDNYSPGGAGGTVYVRPLEASARKLGTQFLLNYHMDSLVTDTSGRVVGVVTHYTGGRIPPGSGTPLQSYADIKGLPGNIKMTQAEVNVWANKGVVITTGGHSSNVNFRRIFDLRLTQEYPVCGEPYSFQDASGEMAAMKIGASLWGASGQVEESGIRIVKPAQIGTFYGYVQGGGLPYSPNTVVLPFSGAIGLSVSSYQDVICVNMLGNRFYDETKGNYASSGYKSIPNYVPDSWLNAQNLTWAPLNYLDAAMAYNGMNGSSYNGGGPIWAIFDSAAVTREKWTLGPPYTSSNFFYQANDLATLAQEISTNQYQTIPMNATTLQNTITRYNSFVTSGVDSDFAKPKPLYAINTPPYYAAWATPEAHDTRTGLRINAQCQVLDMTGTVIAGLYCAGESAGGFQEHGLARAGVFGYIAGTNAAAKSS